MPPMNPAAQVQENLLTPSSQVAPLVHGLLAHSFASTIIILILITMQLQKSKHIVTMLSYTLETKDHLNTHVANKATRSNFLQNSASTTVMHVLIPVHRAT